MGETVMVQGMRKEIKVVREVIFKWRPKFCEAAL